MISILRRFLTDEADIPLGQLTATLATELVERLKRVFSLEISVYSLCGGTLRVIADVIGPDATQTILAYLKQRARPDVVHQQTTGQGPKNDLFVAN